MRVYVEKGMMVLGAGALAALLGCGGAQPTPGPATATEPAPPPKAAASGPAAKEPVETGNECVKAEAQCEGGECVLFIKNGCEQPVSCDATMTVTCKANTDMMEAARRKRETYPAKSDGELRLVGNCESGEVLRTAMKSLACK
jgi:hypothetical protein